MKNFWRCLVTSAVLILFFVLGSKLIFADPIPRRPGDLQPIKKYPPYTISPPPWINILVPEDDAIVNQSLITVSGRYQNAFRITVNGSEAILSQGAFTINNVELHDGENTITAIAYGRSRGQEARDVIHVTFDTADHTPPTSPGQPTEGFGSGDLDWSYGYFHVFWSPAQDFETGVSAYELQERIDESGEWRTLSDQITNTSFAPPNEQHNTHYFYRVRARNGASLWSEWSLPSDGIRLDQTNPLPFTITDDGETTNSTTELHATWTPSSDPETGIRNYTYFIYENAPNGRLIVGDQNAGLATEITRQNLQLQEGLTYYIGVRAYNQAGRYAMYFSDGIRAVTQDTTPPSLNMNPSLDERKAMIGKEYTFTANAQDSDPSPLEYQFELNGNVIQPYSSNNILTYTSTALAPGSLPLTVKARDEGGEARQDIPIYIYRNPEVGS
ncbi:MAG: fibronectin type III domain-containing protein [Candidatus Omnitrophica bacterium]|nr:fibronectin type III domain-containing protein [Candidatus Omnitrophota bacterium]